MRNYREKQKKIIDKSNCKTNGKANVSRLDKEEDKEKDKYNTAGRKPHVIIYSTLFYSILFYSAVPICIHFGSGMSPF